MTYNANIFYNKSRQGFIKIWFVKNWYVHNFTPLSLLMKIYNTSWDIIFDPITLFAQSQTTTLDGPTETIYFSVGWNFWKWVDSNINKHKENSSHPNKSWNRDMSGIIIGCSLLLFFTMISCGDAGNCNIPLTIIGGNNLTLTKDAHFVKAVYKTVALKLVL